MLFTFPSRYWFAIGHGRVFSLGGWSPQIHTGFHVSGITRASPNAGTRGIRLRGCHPLRPAFPGRSASLVLCNCARGFLARGIGDPSTPRAATPRSCALHGFRLDPLSLAATDGISVDFLSSGYLDVSVPRVAAAALMRSARGAHALPWAGSPIRRSAGQRPFAPRRGLSQLATSFVGFPCQGIHRAPLVSSSCSMNPHRDC